MNRFLKKKLPAFLLALIMVIGMMPTAMATDCQHTNWSKWNKLDDAKHQRTCLVNGCEGTQEANHVWPAAYKNSTAKHWKECSDCGAQSAQENHSYSNTMKTDANYHWDQCTVCGYKDNLGGHADLNLDGKCDTCKKEVKLSYVNVTFMNGTATYKAKAKLAKGTAPANPGTPAKEADSTASYTFKGWTTRNPGPNALYDRQSFLTSAQVASTALDEDTVYYALFEANEIPSITYEVKPGEVLAFDRADFRDILTMPLTTTRSAPSSLPPTAP